MMLFWRPRVKEALMMLDMINTIILFMVASDI